MPESEETQSPMIAQRRPQAARWWMWLPAVAWAAVIFGFSSLTGSQVPGGWSIQGHAGEYLVFGALLVWPLMRTRTFVTAVLLATLIASAYAVTDEFHQRFVPGRTPDPVDWATDTAAALAGSSLAAYVIVLRRRREAATTSARRSRSGRGADRDGQ